MHFRSFLFLQSNDSSIQRQLSGIGRHLDYDGLTTFNESLQQRMSQMQSEYEKEIEILRSHLQAATTALLTHASNCTGAGKCILEAKDEIVSSIFSLFWLNLSVNYRYFCILSSESNNEWKKLKLWMCGIICSFTNKWTAAQIWVGTSLFMTLRA